MRALLNDAKAQIVAQEQSIAGLEERVRTEQADALRALQNRIAELGAQANGLRAQARAEETKARDLQTELQRANQSMAAQHTREVAKRSETDAKHREAQRKLERRIQTLQEEMKELGALDARALQGQIEELRRSNHTLLEEAKRLAGAQASDGGETVYDLLLEMARCMHRMGQRRRHLQGPDSQDTEDAADATGAVFQARVERLVARCSEGFGLGVKALGERQKTVVGLLTDVYLEAGRRQEDEAGMLAATRLTNGMVKATAAKRPRV